MGHPARAGGGPRPVRARANMDDATRSLHAAVWAAVDGMASPAQVALLEADASGHRHTLERFLDDVEDALERASRQLDGLERAQVVADYESEFARLEAAYDRLTRPVGAG